MCLTLDLTKELMRQEVARGKRGKSQNYGAPSVFLQQPGGETVKISVRTGQNPITKEWRIMPTE